jgi:hypothetical protein
MYKGRLGIWIAAVAICLVVSFAMQWVPTWFESDDLYVGIDVESDVDMTQVLANTKINKIKLFVQNEDPGVLITSQDLAHQSNYTKYEDLIYSPIVLYARGVYSYDDGLIRVDGSQYRHRVDLHGILTAIEKGQEWADIGFDKYLANGPVTLYIPNQQCSYYDDVVELFYITLNNGKAPDDEVRSELTQRVNNILAKCHMVADIGQAINDEFSNNTKEHKVFVGPEYLYRRGSTNVMSVGGSYNASFGPIYPQHTVYLTANVYVKNVDTENNIGLVFIENMKIKSDFMKTTGWRVKNSVFDLSDVSFVYITNP